MDKEENLFFLPKTFFSSFSSEKRLKQPASVLP